MKNKINEKKVKEKDKSGEKNESHHHIFLMYQQEKVHGKIIIKKEGKGQVRMRPLDSVDS